MAFCSNCFKEIPDGMAFCEHCGAFQAPEAQPVPQQAPVTQPVPQQAPVAQPYQAAPQQPYQAAPQQPYQAAPQQPYQAAPQQPYQAAPQQPYQAAPQQTYQAAPQQSYQAAPQQPYQAAPQAATAGKGMPKWVIPVIAIVLLAGIGLFLFYGTDIFGGSTPSGIYRLESMSFNGTTYSGEQLRSSLTSGGYDLDNMYLEFNDDGEGYFSWGPQSGDISYDEDHFWGSAGTKISYEFSGNKVTMKLSGYTYTFVKD